MIFLTILGIFSILVLLFAAVRAFVKGDDLVVVGLIFLLAIVAGALAQGLFG